MKQRVMKSLILKNNNEIKKLLGKRIKDYRIQSGWSQIQLAKRSGISTHSISNIENGNGFTLDNLIAILRALNLVDNLDLLIPELAPNPFDMIKGIMERQRVSKKDKYGTNK